MNARLEPMPTELVAVASEFFGPDDRHESEQLYYYNIKDNAVKRIAACRAGM